MSIREGITSKPYMQLLLILLLCGVSLILFTLIGGVLAVVLYGMAVLNIENLSDPVVVEGLKLIQLCSAIGVFVVPPIVYGLIRSKKWGKQLGLKAPSKSMNYVLVILLMLASAPAVSWITAVNADMVLPDFLSGLEAWMRQQEDQAAELINAFLSIDGAGSLVYVMIIIAVVPAVGEELLFRGVIQKSFVQWFNNPHWGIWITAILFSALHMQFFGFFPRMLLGVVFGYVFYWSGSLWIPIVGHFINNGSVVLMSYLMPELMNDEILFEGNPYAYIYYLISILLSLGLILWFRRLNQNVS
ncbi:MAG: CPBP family intramembrane metalloprotease [Flavobacteriales bacterium]|nr:CPBP family intramembrane metalloprotease [Flavobacteriales bacterium]